MCRRARYVDTYESSNREEGEYDCRFHSAFTKIRVVVLGTPPRIGQVAETDEPKERPEAYTKQNQPDNCTVVNVENARSRAHLILIY